MSDRYFLGSEEIALDDDESKVRLTHRLRQYLELRHLSVLIGNGCSIPLGSPSMGTVVQFRAELTAAPYRHSDDGEQTKAVALLDKLLSTQPKLTVEDVLALCSALRAAAQLSQATVGLGKSDITEDSIAALEQLVKRWLFIRCSAVSVATDLTFHEQLLRRILLRSTNLPRAKIFTTNYDLVLERALDNLGVMYFDGFLGTIERSLRTESYHYDLYYPGETTEGRVSRVDRVLHLYKLHGSINWRRRGGHIDDVVISHTTPEGEALRDVMIYPSPLKVTEMNGYPYSEMFRHFATHIHQPQSALLVIGYGFGDSHINRLIYQALSVPSFVLIVVTPEVAVPLPGDALGPEHEVARLIGLNSKRILVISGGNKDASGCYTSGAGTLQDFSTQWMPDINELAVDTLARTDAREALAGVPKADAV